MKGLLLILTLILFVPRVNSQTSRIDSLKLLTETSKGDELIANYLELSESYLHSNPSKILEYLGKAQPLISETTPIELKNLTLILDGAGNILMGNFEESKKNLEKGIETARRINNNKQLCIGLNSLSYYYMNNGNSQKSLDLISEVSEIADQEGLVGIKAVAQVNKGSLLTTTGSVVDGLRNLLEALDYFEKINDTEITTRIYNNIAVNYHSNKRYGRALQFYNKTLQNYIESGNLAGQLVLYNNLGEVYKDIENYPEALEYYQKSLDIATNNSSIPEFYKAYGLVGLAETQMLLSNFDIAYQYASEVLELSDNSNSYEDAVATAKLILAHTNFESKKYNDALALLNEALEFSLNAELPDLTIKIYGLQSKIYNKQNKFHDAYNSLNAYVTLNDTLLKQERSQELSQIQLDYELSEKQQEIELLQKNNEIKDLDIQKRTTQTHFLILFSVLLIILFGIMFFYIKSRKEANNILQERNKKIEAQHQELKNANETKNKFLSIIAHDLLNPIGAFKDVITQLANYPEMFSEELRQQITEELRDESENTFFLLNNLLSWARAQQNAIAYKFEKIDVYPLVNNNILINSRYTDNKGITVTTDIKKDLTIEADRNMSNLILRNLISNAIKFTKENGAITIKAWEEDKFINISIADTGVGIAKDAIPNLFNENNRISTYGTKNEKGAGLGLLLCKEFIEINKGKIGVESKVGVGTTFTVTFKKIL